MDQILSFSDGGLVRPARRHHIQDDDSEEKEPDWEKGSHEFVLLLVGIG